MASEDLAKAALNYAGLGWAVHPLKPHEKTPVTAHGCKDATTDDCVIRAWWEECPSANVAVACGPSELLVLDVDGEVGKASRAGLPELPTAPLSETGSGGWHIFCRQPEDVELGNSAGKLGAGLDTRGAGGYVVVPPSVHPNGGVYRWAPGRSPWELEPPEAPAWLVERLLPPPAAPVAPAKPPVEGNWGPWPRYARAAVDRACSSIVSASFGEQEPTLHRESYSIGRLAGGGAVPRDLALALLIHAGCRMPSQSGRRPWLAPEVEDKVRRSFGLGEARPRTPGQTR